MSERNIFTRGLAPSYSSRGDEKIKSVLDSSSSPVSKEDAPSWKVTRDSQGNYYVNGTKAPWMRPPINPDAVPTVDPTSSSSGMDTISQMYTSPEREEELRKASVNKQRILALGDALRHIGNIYNTTRYAPAQLFNNPVNEERGRYLQEKAIRDANNYKYQTYQQAKAAQEAKIRQAERDYAFKVADADRKYGLDKQRADAYLKNQEAQRGYTEARTKNESLKAPGIEADNKLKQTKAENAPKEFELKRRNTESQIAARRDASARGWANYRLAVSREERRRKGNSYGGTDGKRDLFAAPDGSKYTFPKGVINGKNISTIYSDMKERGLITENLDKPTDAQKWDAIMAASSRSKEGLDAFISYAENLDYTYEGGRDLPYMRRIKDRLYDNKKAAPSSYPKKPATQKTITKPSPPRATVSAGTKPSTGNAPKKKKGDFSGFSIYDN